MKNIILSVLFLCFISIASFCFAKDPAFIDDIIWVGCDNLDEPYPKAFKNDVEKQQLLSKGVAICENRAREDSGSHQMLLASYHYFTTKNTKRALYWAIECAGQGNSTAMLILFDAYKSSNGVIGDAEESIKWLWLAASLDNEHAKNLMKNENVIELLKDQKFALSVYEKTRTWMREHPKAFFNPDG